MISELVTEAPVLVTGARGFVAGHIILQLLARGYKVRATLRGITNKHGKEVFPEESTYKYLKEFPNADKNLELVLADLVDPWSSLVLEENDSDVSEEDAVADIQGSLSESNHSHAGSVGSKEGTPFARAWSNAFAGVEYVIHVASPYIAKPPDPEKTLMQPALNGTLHILEMCKATSSVKRLLITSCIHALADNFVNGKVYSETDWNSISNLQRNSYSYSKAKAEFNAYRYVSENDCKFSLISILPGTILGPHLGGKLSFSHKFLTTYLDGTNRGVANLHINISDVRDVAFCHVLAMESLEASGRYICCNNAIPHAEMLQIIHDNFHDIQVPTHRFRDPAVRLAASIDGTGRGEFLLTHLSRIPNISNAKARHEGMVFRPPAQTIVDTCRYFIDYKHITPGVMNVKGSCAIS